MNLGNLASNALSMLTGTAVDALVGGGQIERAKLFVVAADKKGAVAKIDMLEFPINPETVTFKDLSSPDSRTPNVGGLLPAKYGGPRQPRELKFKTWFDTYESRLDVRDVYVRKLQLFSGPVDELHIQPTLMFVWGRLTTDTAYQFLCDLEEFEVTYTMFLPNGAPVRCTVDITLREVTDPNSIAKKFKSPDHAKLHTVRRGDTLHAIAHKEYDNAKEWRRIADANGIDDPMDLEPGARLLIPPILK